jgi:peptide/nickel transport system ATP-binding protein
VESGEARVIIGAPQTDYTRALIAAVPALELTPHG